MENSFFKLGFSTSKGGKHIFQLYGKNVLIKGIRFDFQTWLVASFHAWNEQLRNVENSQNGIFQIKTMNPIYKNTYNN